MTHPTARVLLALTPLAAVLLLASCGAPAASPAAAPTVTVTATVTATAAPAPMPTPTSTADSFTPDAAITAEQAWLLCYGATYGQYADTSTVYGYSDGSASGHSTVTPNADGSFEVLVRFASQGDTPRGAEAICEASGTVGHPTLELRGGRDFG